MHSVFASGSLKKVQTKNSAPVGVFASPCRYAGRTSIALRHDLNDCMDLEWPSSENRVYE